MASILFRCRQQYWKLVAPRRYRAYLRQHATRKLQIGAGANLLAGWLNTTLYPFTRGTVFLDASRPFPLPDASIDLVFSEHTIEHLEYDEAAFMLGECHRILRSGGRIRIATPDLARIVALYTQPEAPDQARYIRWIMDNFRPKIGEDSPAHVINQSFHGWRHKFIFDEVTLRAALLAAGFRDVRRYAAGQSDYGPLRGIERHGEVVGSDEAMRYETMVLEAAKA